MKTEIKYIAEDGKEFKSEKECKKYEAQLLIDSFDGNLHMFDEDCQPSTTADDTMFVKITSKEAWNHFHNLCNNEISLSMDDSWLDYEPGVYFWNEDKYCWVRFSDYEKEYFDIRNKLVSIKLIDC